ncbi:MAG: GCN5-related N-acetyltransferase [Herbinix sp.]|jgi:GNAT superfamily N-acetyltransferase|nr:GCN5-related N-acetyltransferase [Herbinix sp.]
MSNLVLLELKETMINECVDIFIDTFTKEPWYDVYDSREQVVNFFHNHFNNNYFVGYVASFDRKIVALSIGIKKPWIQGFEYYIDEFCVSYNMQGRGIGSWFIKAIEEDIHQHDMNSIILNTEKDYPSHTFYEQNGFKMINNMIVLCK